METNDKWAELRKPLSMRKLTVEQICDEFLTELQAANKNLQYSDKYVFENDKIAACGIDYHDPKLEELLSKKGLTDTEKMYGIHGGLSLEYTKSTPESGYEAHMTIPFILTGDPDTKLDSMRKIGGFRSNDQCKITAVHVYKESIPIQQTNVVCSSFNRVNDVIKYINEGSNLSRRAAKMERT